MPQVALWRTGLLLSFLCSCACLEKECVLGIVGRPVSLPCVYPQLLTFVNVSIEWRRGEEVVLKSVWKKDGDVKEWSINRATTPADAALTGNVSLQLPTVDPTEHNTYYYSLLVISGENQSTELCTVCLKTAAGFSSPLLQREEAQQGEEAAFVCHSTGGFPEPAVYWLINTEEPPEGSVRTLAALLPDSHLYNITSYLTANISKDASVSCIIENLTMNETLTSTKYGVKGSPVVGRASEALWIFSTALCVVVGAMVLAGVIYQIHLDRMSNRKKNEYLEQHPNRGYKRRCPVEEEEEEEEEEEMKPEGKETDV